VLTGTPRAPVAQGTIFVREGVVRPANREEVLSGVTGTIHLAGSELKIAHFEARQGKQGRITVAEGIGHLKDLRISDYAFDIDASHITAFSSGEYVIELDGKFHVKSGVDLGGPLPLPYITGNATVIEGVFLTNFADPDRQAAWQGPAVIPPWTYDIAVEARNNLWWRPAEANIEGKLTDFEVIQDLDRFLLLGQVDALRGRYYFLGNQFDVTTGTMFFDSTQPMNPTVNAVLTTDKSLPLSQGGVRETITLSVTGRARQPTVTLASSPSSLSQTEIATLLTYGQLQGGATAIGQAGAGFLIRRLAQEIPELSAFEVGSKVDEQDNATTAGAGTSRIFTTVGVSRYMTRDLLLRYSQVVGDVAEAQRLDYQDLAAEYRINRLLFLSGQVTRRKGVLVTSQDQTLYNLDVRARYEY
jgi:autotransporter translocation and assembly factor TamB